MKYPEEIYWDNFVPGISLTRQKTFLVERAYDMGKADAKNLDGYSNLTAAIQAGDPIDWEELDGKKVQCVKPGVGTLRGKLERDSRWKANKLSGWWNADMTYVYVLALMRAWRGEDGWTLWVEGEVPIRRKTADQLEVGTYFLGKARGDDPSATSRDRKTSRGEPDAETRKSARMVQGARRRMGLSYSYHAVR